jgi:hypothetical protein
MPLRKAARSTQSITGRSSGEEGQLSRSGFIGAAAVWVVACSPAVVGTSDTSGADAGPGAGGTGGSGFSLPPGASAPGGNGGAGGAGLAPAPGDPVCAATRAEATPVPIDLYIMEDQSGSMNVDGKWDAVRNALTAFVRLPAARGTSVGMGFFPRFPGPVPEACQLCQTADCLASCGCVSIRCSSITGVCQCAAFSSSSCFEADYAFPAVPVSELPGAASRIVEILESVRPEGGTPTLPALQGAITYAKSWTASTGRRVAIALATDGEPFNCGYTNTVEAVSDLARSAAAGGLPVFVVGVGAQLAALNAIAAAGGTGRAYLVEGFGVEKQFLAALQSIQGAAARLSCSYSIPAPPSGQRLDPATVNVEFSGGTPPQTTAIGQVADKARCDARGGWYYDDPRAPTQIELCPATCTVVNGAGTNRLAVTFGCRTNVID